MQCPFCKEEIQDGAIKCKHCQSMLNGSSETKPLLNQIRPLGKWLMIGIFVLSISAFFFTNFSITVPIVGKMGASMYDAVKITNQSETSGDIAEQKPDIKDVANNMYEDSKHKGGSMLPFIFMGIAVLGLALHYLLTIVWGICTFVLRRTFRSINMMWLALAVQFPILFAIGGKIILSDLKSEMLKNGGQEDPFAAMGAAMVSTFSIDPGIIMWILMAVSIIALALHFIDKQMGILSTDGVATDLNESASINSNKWTKPAIIVGLVVVVTLIIIGIFSGSDNKLNKNQPVITEQTHPDQGETDPALPNESDANVVIGTFNGCSTHQGITECGINISDKTIYISDSSTSESVFSNIDMENWIGKNVKLTGSMEAGGDYFIATSIELAE